MKSFYQLMLELNGYEPQLPVNRPEEDLSPSIPQKMTLELWLKVFDSLIDAIRNESKRNGMDETKIANFNYYASNLSKLISDLVKKSPLYGRSLKVLADNTLKVIIKLFNEVIIATKKIGGFDIPSTEYLYNFLKENETKFLNFVKERIYK